VFSAYLTLYAFGRFWVESLRVDPAQLLFGVRFNLLLFGVVFLLAGAWLISNLRRVRPLS
jgi:prolipoprotein diacylglyceryltransferase